MPNIASVLKEEVARLARKEVRAATAALKKAVVGYRSDIAKLKRRTSVLEQQVHRLAKPRGRAAPSAGDKADDARSQLRFSAKGMASQRRRLGLSAHDYGLLVGASGQSVYKWESGAARPRARHLPAIAAVRAMGKKQAAARLAELR